MSLAKLTYKSLFIGSFILLIASCSKDEACTPKAFNENIVGSWKITSAALGFSLSGTGNFNSDGTFSTNPDDLIIDGELNGVPLTKKTYTISGNNIIFKASSANGSDNISVDGTQNTNECSKIVIGVFGGLGTITLTK